MGRFWDAKNLAVPTLVSTFAAKKSLTEFLTFKKTGLWKQRF